MLDDTDCWQEDEFVMYTMFDGGGQPFGSATEPDQDDSWMCPASCIMFSQLIQQEAKEGL